MSVQVKHRGDSATNLAAFTPAQREIVVDTTNNRMIVGDGSTVGGWPAAKLSEVALAGVPVPASTHGAAAQFQWIEQIITCSGSTTNISLGLTGVIYAVALRVVTAVTGCTSITVNDNQNGNGHWGSGIGISAGTTNAGAASPGPYYNGSTTLALAAVGGGASFAGGTVRVSVLIMTITPPIS